jgi:hypothetical protein
MQEVKLLRFSLDQNISCGFQSNALICAFQIMHLRSLPTINGQDDPERVLFTSDVRPVSVFMR